MSTEETELQDEQKQRENEQTESPTSESEGSELTVEEQLQKKVEDLNEKHLRLYSEFENFRRRTAREKLDLIANASEGVVKKLLPVLDDFERAINTNEKVEDVKAIKEGFDLLFQKTKSILNTQGLKEMESNKTQFDAELYEAITKIPAPSKKLKGKVIDTIEKGYYLNDKIIRHAKVVVGE